MTEAAGQGIDTVISALASYTLGANVENLTLSGTGVNGTGNTLNNLINGNGLGNTLDGGGGNDELFGFGGADSLVGGAGNDTLIGGPGVDTMKGGAGNDTYFVRELADSVIEAAGGGVDLVKTTIDGFMLYDNVENMTLLGGTDLFAVGNKLGNFITGNGGANSINGLDGNDTLDGAGGADTLGGGKGNDTYFVDDVNDKVAEAGGQGKDTVFASADFTLETNQEVEIITLTGGIDLEATGNNLANTINGDSGDNALDGLGAGDTLNGNVGNDILDGGTGDDVMNGGKDSDTYYVDSSKDKITEAAGQGLDMVFSKASSFTLGANIENAIMLAGAGNLTGNTLNNSIDGNSVGNVLDGGGGNDELEGHDGVDTLKGGAGNDTLDGGIVDDKMTGGAGNDAYEVDSFSDVINELAGGGIDTMRTGLSGFLLAAQVENLVLTGSADISGSGNSLANFLTGNGGKNTLTGNAGNDTLDGGGVNDTLIGGAGNDTYYVDHLGDKVQESAGGGKDTVISSVSFSFTDSEEIETVILTASGGTGSVGNNFANTITMTGTGTATINGNDGNDTLTGGSGIDLILGGTGNDVINGGGGNDSLLGDANDDKLNGGEGDDALNGGTGKDAMVGGKGSDFYAVSEVGDTVTELAGQGTDTVQSNLVSYTLAANVERLMLSTGAVNGTGNTLDNLIFGNLADNKLDGGGGADIISGGDGNDSILGGLGFDYLSGGSGNDTLKGGSDVDYLEGGSGKDVMYGEAGKDGFLYRIEAPGDLATLGGDTINGFQTGVDRIELTDLLTEFGISAANAFSGGFVLLTKDGSNTLVQFDQNGGANSLITLATVANANVVAGDLMLDSQLIL
jgi:Ca2+-binding RTX toxin-like protein